MRGVAAALASILGLACAQDSGPEPPPPCDHTPRVSTLDVATTFRRTAVWDVSGPLAIEPQAGDKAADLAVDLIVESLGLPAFLDGAAQSLLSTLLHDAIAAFVDDLFPAELSEAGRYRADLMDALSRVEITSVGTFHYNNECNLNEWGGPIHVISVRLLTDPPIPVSLTDLLSPPSDFLNLDNPASGHISDQDSIVFTTFLHPSYGALIRTASVRLLGVTDVEGYIHQVASTYDCAALADNLQNAEDIIGQFTNHDAELRAWLMEVAALLDASCDDLRGGLEENLLPLLHADIWLTEFGYVTMTDTSGDLVVDHLESEPDPTPGQPVLNRGYNGTWNFDGTGNTPPTYLPVTFTGIQIDPNTPDPPVQRP